MKYLLIILLFIACKKEQTESLYATFYTGKYSDKTMLYVDNVYRGEITKISDKPLCGDNINDKVITLELSEGKHTYMLASDSKLGTEVQFNVISKCQIVLVK